MSIRILAFNTVTDLCSVAVMIDKKIYSSNIIAYRTHSERILFMIDKLLVDSGILLKSLDCIVFDQGPGSFMGVRIGMSIAQGLSLGASLPLVSVSSLNVLAEGARRIFSSKQIITMINARTRELYLACYSYITKNSNFFWICNKSACLLSTESVQQFICKLTGRWTLIGTGWNDNSTLQSCINKTDSVMFKQVMFPEAQDMLPLGVYAYRNKMFLAPDQIKPIYLRFTNLF